MNSPIKYLKTATLIVVCFAFFVPALQAQDQPPPYVIDAVRSIEKMLDSKGDEAIRTFMAKSMVKPREGESDAMMNKLKTIRTEMSGLLDDIMLEPEENGFRMILSGRKQTKQLRVVLDAEAKKISDLFAEEGPEPMNITVDNLDETVDQLEKEGLAGLIYVRLKGELLIKRPFGMANQEMEWPNTVNTVFATGSRPIDYTVAAIQLLDQRKLISVEDKIGKYFEDVPSDKRSMTIRHLLTGQSGLPDFFHTAEDWDPDLAWVDRETAIKRLLSQKLLFAPGTGRSHSHAAFGLLAALLEKVSDKSYYEFISQNFFEPAGMQRTGEYGERKELGISDFAAGGGPQIIGLPNIPPNWGPTSWLIKGSGGMYSTLGDLLKFYEFIRSDELFDEAHRKLFQGASVQLDGSDRGFELFSAYKNSGNECFLFLNEIGNREKSRQVFRALEGLVEP